MMVKHEWVMEGDEPEYFDLEGYHGGPKCVRCGQYFCQHCEPDIWDEPCENQDETLPFEEETKSA